MSRQTIPMFNSCKPVKILLYFTTEIGQKKHAMSYKIYNTNSLIELEICNWKNHESLVTILFSNRQIYFIYVYLLI